MIYRLMIFLICCSVGLADIGCLVGGSSANNVNAGWFRSDLIAVTDTFSANGGPVDNKDGSGNVTNDGGSVLITDTDQFGNTAVGMFVYVDFTDEVHVDGRYEITAVTDDDSIRITLAYVGDEAVDVWRVGGAVPIVDGIFGLQHVLDDDLGSAAANNVDIYIAVGGTLTATIDWDTGGGTATTTKSLIGTNSSYVDDGTQITIDTSANLANGLFQFYNSTPYIYIKNIIFDAQGDEVNSADHCVIVDNIGGVQSVVFDHCRFTDADDTCIEWGGVAAFPLVLIDCEIDNADAGGLASNHPARGTPVVIGCKIHDNGGDGIFIGSTYAHILFTQIYDNGGDGINIGSAAIDNITIACCTITRNDGNGIDFNAAADNARLYNNVVVYNGGYSYKFNGSTPMYFGYNLGSTQGAETAITDEVADGAFAALFNGNNIASSQTEDALFETVTDGSEDFTPETGSDLIDVAVDIEGTADIGSVQLDAAGGGGGGQPVIGGSVIR